MCFSRIGVDMFELIDELQLEHNSDIKNKTLELYYNSDEKNAAVIFLHKSLKYGTMTCKKAIFHITQNKELIDFQKLYKRLIMKKIIITSFDDGDNEIFNMSIFSHQKSELKELVKLAFDGRLHGIGDKGLNIWRGTSNNILTTKDEIMQLIDDAVDITDEEIDTLSKFCINKNKGMDIIEFVLEF